MPALADVFNAIFNSTRQTIAVEGNASGTAVPVSGSVTGTVSVSGGSITGTVAASGGVASATADSGNPVKIGAIAQDSATLVTAGANANRMNSVSDLLGRLITSDAPATWTKVAISTANTAISLCTQAGVASRRHIITSWEVNIQAAAVGAADVNVYVRDGATATGTVLFRSTIGALAVRGTTDSQRFTHGLECSVGNAATLDVDAAGASAVAIANLAGYTA